VLLTVAKQLKISLFFFEVSTNNRAIAIFLPAFAGEFLNNKIFFQAKTKKSNQNVPKT